MVATENRNLGALGGCRSTTAPRQSAQCLELAEESDLPRYLGTSKVGKLGPQGWPVLTNGHLDSLPSVNSPPVSIRRPGSKAQPPKCTLSIILTPVLTSPTSS